jgi:hypothetical protein
VFAKSISACIEAVQRLTDFRKFDLAGVIDRVQTFVVFELKGFFSKIGRNGLHGPLEIRYHSTAAFRQFTSAPLQS